MKINLDEIQKIISILFSNLKKQKGNEIELKNDFYWDISGDELYNPYNEPKDITLGQLSDDLKELMRLSQHDDEAIPYDLERIAVILKALGIENSTLF